MTLLRILGILAFFSPVFRPPFKYWTIWQPNIDLPFEYWTSLVFRWLMYKKLTLTCTNAWFWRKEYVKHEWIRLSHFKKEFDTERWGTNILIPGDIQWGSKYQMPNCWKCLITRLLLFWILNALIFEWHLNLITRLFIFNYIFGLVTYVTVTIWNILQVCHSKIVL